MTTTVSDKPEIKKIDWINPHSECSVTLEEYRREMLAAESSGFIRFEDHKKNMNKWMAAKLQ